MTWWYLLSVALVLAFAVYALAVEVAPESTGRVLGVVPGVRDLAMTRCSNCGGRTIARGAESMPVIFPMTDQSDGVMLRLCRPCSREMTGADRLELLREHAPEDVEAELQLHETEASDA